MINWIKRHWFGILITTMLSVMPVLIIAEVIHYNCESDNKVYVEWTVYDGLGARKYSGTYDMKGSEFEVHNYWQSPGKYRGSYRVVNIVDKDAWGVYLARQGVCIYIGMNDVEVNTIKLIE